MSDHLRLAGADPARQLVELEQLVRATPALMQVLVQLRELALPDELVVSGAIYNAVWNHLTGRPLLTGIKDFDVVYFDADDVSYEAEDRVIHWARSQFAESPVPVEVRNQARVHLWFPQRFGMPYPALHDSADMLRYFSTRAYAVAARLNADDSLSIFAPFGLADLFSFRLAPNLALANRTTHDAKAQRAMAVWPELGFVPWPEGA